LADSGDPRFDASFELNREIKFVCYLIRGGFIFLGFVRGKFWIGLWMTLMGMGDLI
jgi:hypothetical protein